MDDVFAYASSPKRTHFLLVPQLYNKIDAEKFIASQILLDKEKYQGWVLAENEVVIGRSISDLTLSIKSANLAIV